MKYDCKSSHTLAFHLSIKTHWGKSDNPVVKAMNSQLQNVFICNFEKWGQEQIFSNSEINFQTALKIVVSCNYDT